ncbi:putative cytochrome b561 and DOMON domain-containing protein [Helianthus annuus]|nr:putative cytochrome b561 and DOMON domain-containing protein [Helianthus annuus]KAJ0747713.1 putative cytochrome b561 and DOMON domain-containing protein [Helianthus annuus]KAJ0923391.1 putative cytochrome b561 and DOMON domain-containing protein [Helianthus annuus]
MGKSFHPIFCIFLSVLTISYAQDCNTYRFSNNNVYSTCITLPVLNSQLHWNYHPTNATVNMAYLQTGVTNSQWVAWAINIGRSGMVGTQCLVGVVSSNGSVQGYTSSVTSYKTRLQPTRLSFDVPSITAEMVNGDVVIYATLVLPNRRTSFNHLWQVGPVVGGAPSVHQMGSANRKAVGTVDFATGQTSANSGDTGGSQKRQRNVSSLRAIPERFCAKRKIEPPYFQVITC